MSFNHYAKIKRILADYPDWVVRRIDEPTTAATFSGQVVTYDHYYRVYDASGAAISYCKFQQLERFARTMNLPVEAIPIITD